MDQPTPAPDRCSKGTSAVDRLVAPPMRVVTKGWGWPRPDEEATVEELEKANREQAERRERRRGPFGWW